MPQYQKSVTKARAAEGILILNALSKAAQSYCLATGNQPSAANWNDLDIDYPSTKDATDSVRNLRRIGKFNCYFVNNSIVCADTNNLYSLGASWPCYPNSSLGCVPRDGFTGRGAAVCRALFGGTPACAEQCSVGMGNCQTVCDPVTMACSMTCSQTETCNAMCY